MKIVTILNNYIEAFKFLNNVDKEKIKVITLYEKALERVPSSQVTLPEADTLFSAYQAVTSFEDEVAIIQTKFKEAEALLTPYLEAIKEKSVRYTPRVDEIYYIKLEAGAIVVTKS